MQIKRRALTAGATFFLAAATGHVMQNGGSISASLDLFRPATTAAPAVPEPTTPVAAAEVAKPLPTIDGATVVSLSADATALPSLPASAAPELPGGQSLGPRMLKVESGYTRAATDADAEWSAFGLACAEPEMTLSAKPHAMVGLRLTAPCAPASLVQVSIDGLNFDAVTDSSGDLSLDLPALSATPDVTATFRGGKALTASATVTGLEALRRVAVQWTGGFDLALDVYESGAGWDDPGHVRAGSVPSPKGGAILTLGDAAMPGGGSAHVYSGGAVGDTPRIEVSAEVTARTCGRILTGTILHGAETGVVREPVSLTMPACDNLGGYVVLSVDDTTSGAVSVANSGG